MPRLSEDRWAAALLRAVRAVALGLSCLVAIAGCDRKGNPLALTLPASVVLVAGNGQTAPVSTAVSIPPTVRVLTASGSPLSGITVTWEETGGVGAVNPTSSVTNAQGEATTEWIYGDAPGSQEVTATVEGLPGVVFTGTATGL